MILNVLKWDKFIFEFGFPNQFVNILHDFILIRVHVRKPPLIYCLKFDTSLLNCEIIFFLPS